MKSFYLYLTAMKSIIHFLLTTAFGLSSTLFCFASEGNLTPTKISTQSTNYSATLTTEKKAPDSWILIVDAKEEDREGVWLDFNGNGICEEGEKPSPREFGGFMVKPMSSSTLTIYGKLTMLNCQDNKLIALDITNSPYLEELNCGQNKLQSVDLTQNKVLKKLEIYGMNLQTLDLTHNPQLESVKCYGNLLTSLNLSNNPLIKSLGCDENKLKTLDLSQQTKLESLMANNNKLTTVDLSNCVELENVTLFENQLESLVLGNLPKLKELYAYNNQLSSINVAGCPQLVYLSIGMNKLTALDLSQNKAIADVFCPINFLGDEAVTTLIANLPDRTSETEQGKLYIIDTDIVPSDGNFCSKENVAIATSKKWSVYDYRQGKNEGANPYSGANKTSFYTKDQPKCILTSTLSEGAWDLQIDAPIERREKAWIDRNGDGIYQQGEEIKDWNIPTKILRTTNKLTIYGNISKLYCSQNGLVELNTTELVNLTQLACRDNDLSSLDLSQNKNLEELICYNNKFSSLNLDNCSNLLRLDCENNQLTSLDLSKCTMLQQLYCHSNQFKELNLTANSFLERLNCSRNNIERISLAPDNRLRIVNCHSNRLSYKETEQLTTALCNRSSMSDGGFLVAVNTLNSEEKNLWSTQTVDLANSKNWIVYDWKNGENKGHNIFPGATGTSPVEKTGKPFTLSGMEVTLTAEVSSNVTLYTLVGEMLLKPSENRFLLPYKDIFILKIGETSYLITPTN